MGQGTTTTTNQERGGLGAWRQRAAGFKRLATLALPGFAVLFLAGLVVFTVWARQIVAADVQARLALDSNDAVAVARTEWVEFIPRDADPETGVIFYPGGKADPVAYAPILRDLAANGHLVMLCPMPFNLALLAPEAANRVISRHPEIKKWVIAGHSLGGVMAADFAARHPEHVAGLLLWASYPANSTNLSELRAPVMTIYGTADDLSTPQKITDSLVRLPPATQAVPIEGAGHWDFGDFSADVDGSPDDRPAHQAAILAATQVFISAL